MTLIMFPAIRRASFAFGQKELNSVDMTEGVVGKKMIESAVNKLRAGYVPPIVVIGRMDFDQVRTIIGYELIANFGPIEPRLLVYSELNCSERMSRHLSVSANVGGRTGHRSKPSEWDYVPPDGNEANLLLILCPKQ
jgi:hypothetical protein